MDHSKFLFNMRCANHLWFNTTLLKRRHFDAQLASMQQSGTHWIRYMISQCLAAVYDKPAPTSIQDQSFIGNPRRNPGPKYAELPQLASSHSLPHAFMYNPAVSKSLTFPKYIILIRDMRHGLVSGYEKWKHEYQIDFSTFLKSTPFRKKEGYYNDIWRQMEFLNAWGRLAEMDSYDSLVIRYEEMQKDTLSVLRQVCTHLEINASEEILEKAVSNSSKSEMAKSATPNTPNERIIREERKHSFEWYSPEDRALFQEICDKHLKCHMGYDYSNWSYE